MLTYEEFREELAKGVPEYLPENIREEGLEIQTITSLNNQEREILIPAGTPEAGSYLSRPVLYLDDIYRQYENRPIGVDEICREVAEGLVSAISRAPDPVEILSQVSEDKVFACLINRERNETLLSKTPHLILGDLAVICKAPVSGEKMGLGTVTVDNALMEKKGWNKDDMFISAVDNMQEKDPLLISRMEDAIALFPDSTDGKKEYTFDELSDLPTDTFMYVVSNKQHLYGDGLIFMKDKVEMLSEKLEASLILIPSSVHEIIVVTDSSPDLAKSCIAMVREVNLSNVDPKEQLSNSIYRFDKDRREMERYTDDGRIEEMKLEDPDEIREPKMKTGQER